MSKSYKYGIDFGTTNSSISIIEEDIYGNLKPVLFKVDYDGQPHQVLKSIVGFKDGKEVVGEEGISKLKGIEDNPIREVKMKLLTMGKDAAIPSVPRKRYTDAIAAILRRLKEEADNAIGDAGIKPSGVVMGHPCDIVENVKEEYYKSLVKAGYFENIEDAKKGTEYLDEPCAVAVYYGNQSIYQNQRTLIFDFGGGTLDIAIVDIKDPSMKNQGKKSAHEVKAKDSKYNAGEYFTKILFSKVFFPAYTKQHCNGNALEFLRKFREIGCSKDTKNADDLYDQLCEKAGVCWKLIQKMEYAKAMLSFNDSIDFSFEWTSPDRKENVVLENTTLRRIDFEKALEPELHDIELRLKKLFKNNGIPTESISRVILAGGSSAIPCVRQLLESLFPGKIEYDKKTEGPYYVNMMTCISQGLAIHGYYDNPADVLDNVTAHSYGFWNTFKKEVKVVIPKGTSFKATDVNLTKKGILPMTDYCSDAVQRNLDAKAFKMDIYEDNEKILTCHFDKTNHSGHYKIFFAIDAKTGTLEVKVWDTLFEKWIEDVGLIRYNIATQ